MVQNLYLYICTQVHIRLYRLKILSTSAKMFHAKTLAFNVGKKLSKSFSKVIGKKKALTDNLTLKSIFLLSQTNQKKFAFERGFFTSAVFPRVPCFS